MKEKILWICPSRKRPERLARLIESWNQTTDGLSDLLVAIDSDDTSYNNLIKEHQNIIWEKNDPIFGSFLNLLNAIALKYVDEYKYIGFMEDDIVFETAGYESQFIEKLNELGETAIVHAKDGVDKIKFISIPVVNSYIIKKLGWFAPPCLKSLWADNFWRELANNVKTYYKFDNILIKHYHYSKHPEIEKDEISIVVDSNYSIDGENYKKYMETDFQKDMEKLKCSI
jgi:hypothetical protein